MTSRHDGTPGRCAQEGGDGTLTISTTGRTLFATLSGRTLADPIPLFDLAGEGEFVAPGEFFYKFSRSHEGHSISFPC